MIYTTLLLIFLITSTIYIFRHKILKSLTPYLVSYIVSYTIKSSCNSKTERTFTVNGKHAIIKFMYFGSQCKIYVPYDRKLVSKMSSSKIYLEKENGEKITLSQKPGIPFLVTPSQLGGNKITIHKNSGEVFTFIEDQIPTFN